MKPHPQAEILRAIADGGGIEAFNGKEWFGITPMTALRFIYDGNTPLRIKPQIVNINGFEVPEPMREAPKLKTRFWLTDPLNNSGISTCTWHDGVMDKAWLSLGICHSTKEAATIHAKALLSFTRRI